MPGIRSGPTVVVITIGHREPNFADRDDSDDSEWEDIEELESQTYKSGVHIGTMFRKL